MSMSMRIVSDNLSSRLSANPFSALMIPFEAAAEAIEQYRCLMYEELTGGSKRAEDFYALKTSADTK